MPHYILTYSMSDKYAERSILRAAHLEHVNAAVERGDMLLAGTIDDDSDLAMFIFECDNTFRIEAFARGDPYFTEGLVDDWSIRKWTPEVGSMI
jgi:uncharacterized protein